MKSKEEGTSLAFNLEDIFKLNEIHSLSVSPDGSSLVCVVSKSIEAGNRRLDEILLIDLDTKKQEIITPGTKPSWSPDGLRIAFLTAEYGNRALWIYNVATKSKRFLVEIDNSDYFMGHLANKNFTWSPDGEFIAYVGADPKSQRDRSEEENVRVFDNLLYKTQGGRVRPLYSDHLLTHLWCISASGGVPINLTSGAYNEHSLDWSPDGEQIVFVSDRSSNPDYTYQNDLWTVHIKAKEITRLTDSPYPAFSPQWSPDGKHISYLSTRKKLNSKDSPVEDLQIYLHSLETNEDRCVTPVLDRRVEDYSWCEDCESLYFTYGSEGTTYLARLDISSGHIENILGDKNHILEYAMTSKGEILLVATKVTSPGGLYLYSSENEETTSLTQANNFLINERKLSDAETFWFDSFDKKKVQGWIIKPFDFEPGRKYPLVLVIHGGPHNMFGYDFEIRMQVLASAGYGVVYMNPRGSTGYGQAFTNGTLMNWGGEDYQDLMTGMDFVTGEFGWVDKDRMGVTGQSYGGYMTNWVITQTTRFKAGISDGGISNLISFSGTSLYHLLIEAEFNGKPWDNYPLLWQWSPLREVKNVKTPTLFLHGETDNEVPFSQSEEMYVALKKRGIDTELVQYLEEGHGWQPDLKPKNRYDLYQRTINWLDRYVKIRE